MCRHCVDETVCRLNIVSTKQCVDQKFDVSSKKQVGLHSKPTKPKQNHKKQDFD